MILFSSVLPLFLLSSLDRYLSVEAASNLSFPKYIIRLTIKAKLKSEHQSNDRYFAVYFAVNNG